MEAITGQLDRIMEDPSAATDPTLLIVAAMIHNREGQFEASLKYIHNPSTLEMCVVPPSQSVPP